jgi:imidazolonepropionase-like amidohydrolase
MRVPVLGSTPSALSQGAAATTMEEEQADNESSIRVLFARVVIPGRGDPIENGGVVIKGATIEWVGAYHNMPSEFKDIKPLFLRVLMPGLWDCHTHFMAGDVVQSMTGGQAYLPGANALIGAISVKDLRETLMAGYTSVRELEGYAGDLWPAIRDGHLVGPNVYSSHGALSITGGHGDDHDMPITTVVEAMERGGMPAAVCDGVDGCTKMVRTMVRRGARVIKVCSSGGVLSLLDDPEDRQFSDAELKAIVDEAARSRRAVAAHAIGKAGIMAAIRAGVQSIEHGMYLDEEVAALMKDKGVTFVATQHIVRVMSTDYLDGLPAPIRAKLLKIVERSKSSYRLAVSSGVRIALGTDMLSSDARSRLCHGNNAQELLYAAEAGMTPLQVIESATANGPGTLGRMAPKSGQLRAGYDADILAVSANPLDDLAVLANPDKITHVWKGGKLYKKPNLGRMSE